MNEAEEDEKESLAHKEKEKAEAQEQAGKGSCWVHSYLRGALGAVDSCPSDKEVAMKDSEKPAE